MNDDQTQDTTAPQEAPQSSGESMVEPPIQPNESTPTDMPPVAPEASTSDVPTIPVESSKWRGKSVRKQAGRTIKRASN